MKLRSTLILLVIVALLGGATYAYRTNATVKGVLDEYVIGQEEPKIEVPKPIPLAVYEIADPTGSGNSTYAIPRIDTLHIGRVLDLFFRNGGGSYWLSHLDDRSADNPVLFLEVPAAFVAFPAIERNGQNSYSWQQAVEKHRMEHDRWISDSLGNANTYAALRARFLKEAHAHLNNIVYVRSKKNNYTDAIGALNAAFRSLSVEDDGQPGTKKVVVLFSDMEHTAATGAKLIACPENLTVVSVNPKPGASRKVMDAVELDHPDRVLRLLEQASRPTTNNSIATNTRP